MLGEQRRQHVRPIEQNGAHPGQVIESDLIDDDARRLDAEQPSQQALEADRDVAEAHCPMARVEKRTGDDSDWIREVDDPGLGRRPRSHAFRNVEDDRHRAHGFRKAAGARRLLPDAAALEWLGLVAEPGRLAADAKLQEHEVGAVDRTVEIVGDLEPAAVALPLEHPRGHPAHDVATFGIDVLEHELADLEPRQTRDELGRVRRAAADDRDLHRLVNLTYEKL